MFLAAVDIMKEKGAYTLKGPLETLTILLTTNDKQSTAQYLELLFASSGLCLDKLPL